MFGFENLKGKKGGSKTFSVADDLHIISKKKEDEWGEFDEDWGFRIHDIPKEFRDEKKFRNFLLAKEEEKKQKLILYSKPYQIDFEPISNNDDKGIELLLEALVKWNKEELSNFIMFCTGSSNIPSKPICSF